MLATLKGRGNGIAFTVGWVISLAALVTVVVPAGSGGDASGSDDGPASWIRWLKLGFGVLFLLGVEHMARPAERRARDGATRLDEGDRQLHSGQGGRPSRASPGLRPLRPGWVGHAMPGCSSATTIITRLATASWGCRDGVELTSRSVGHAGSVIVCCVECPCVRSARTRSAGGE
ncbi:hypothetical protein [Streptomyces griseus]